VAVNQIEKFPLALFGSILNAKSRLCAIGHIHLNLRHLGGLSNLYTTNRPHIQIRERAFTKYIPTNDFVTFISFV